VYSLPVEDLKNIAERVSSFWPKNQNFLLTGATGFFGRWMVESLAYLEETVTTGNRYHVISRQKPTDVFQKIPVLKKSFFYFHQLDLQNPVSFKEKFEFILHGAADVTINSNSVKMDGILDSLGGQMI
jgi:nucleoside-diphosphate-sugar epimerase